MTARRRGSAIVLALLPLFPLSPRAPRADAQPCTYEEHCDCDAPGITLRWKAAYCMALNQTDDFEQAGVQRCLARRDPASVRMRSACAQNLYWKTRLCGELHKGQKKATDDCVRDRAMIPRIVAVGAGGDM